MGRYRQMLYVQFADNFDIWLEDIPILCDLFLTEATGDMIRFI